MFLFLIGDAELLYDLSVEWYAEVAISDEEMDAVADRLMASKNRPWTLTQVNSIGIPTREYQEPQNNE